MKGAYTWKSGSGYEGLTVLFWSNQSKEFLSCPLPGRAHKSSIRGSVSTRKVPGMAPRVRSK